MQKITLLAILLLSISNQPLYAQSEHWDVYEAQYKDGPGTTVLDMGLKDGAPYKDWPYLVKAIIHYKACKTEDGFPSTHAEMDKLQDISNVLEDYMKIQVHAKCAGSFMHHCDRSEYLYVADTSGIRQKLRSLLSMKFPDVQYSITTKLDTSWGAYLEFLYPNDETQDFMQDTKVVMKLSDAGDKLTQPRKVDHWAYFIKASDRQAFMGYVKSKGFNIEEVKSTTTTDHPFALHFSRMDKVDLPSITSITWDLKQKAKSFQGDYDGWETEVVK
jgi:hypothetical protein